LLKVSLIRHISATKHETLACQRTKLTEYAAVGKGFNLASRLEISCTPGRIKVSYPVYLLTKDHFDYDEPKEESLKGFSRQFKACELAPSETQINQEALK